MVGTPNYMHSIMQVVKLINVHANPGYNCLAGQVIWWLVRHCAINPLPHHACLPRCHHRIYGRGREGGRELWLAFCGHNAMQRNACFVWYIQVVQLLGYYHIYQFVNLLALSVDWKRSFSARRMVLIQFCIAIRHRRSRWRGGGGLMHNFSGIINEWYDASLAVWHLLVNNSHVTAESWRWWGGLLAFLSTWAIDLLIHSVSYIHSLIQFPIHRLVTNNRTSPINDKLLCWLKGGGGGGGVPGEDI